MPGTLEAPSPILDLAAYQAGSVVSNTLAKEAGGTVTLFAFDEGQELSTHTAPFDALVLVLEGRAEVTIGDAAHELGRDHAIRMPANVPHAVRAAERLKMLLVMIRAA